MGIVSLGSREKITKRLAKLKERKEINFQCNEDHLGETDHFGEMFTRSTRKLYKSWRGIYKKQHSIFGVTRSFPPKCLDDLEFIQL